LVSLSSSQGIRASKSQKALPVIEADPNSIMPVYDYLRDVKKEWPTPEDLAILDRKGSVSSKKEKSIRFKDTGSLSRLNKSQGECRG
jgi:hypothetical protein